MTLSITERIQELRREIADLGKDSTAFLQSGRKGSMFQAGEDHRRQRLEQIKAELRALAGRSTDGGTNQITEDLTDRM